MHVFFLILQKDLLIEARRKDLLVALFSSSLLLSITYAVSIEGAILSPAEKQSLIPCLLWLTTFITGMFATERLLHKENEEHSLAGLMLAGAPAEFLYCSKVFVTFFGTLLGHLVNAVILTLLLNFPLSSYFLPLAGLSLIVLFAYSCLSVLLAAITVHTEGGNFLYPILSLPLLLPLLFAAMKATSQVIGGVPFNLFDFTTLFLLCLGLVYGALGLALFEVVIKE